MFGIDFSQGTYGRLNAKVASTYNKASFLTLIRHALGRLNDNPFILTHCQGMQPLRNKSLNDSPFILTHCQGMQPLRNKSLNDNPFILTLPGNAATTQQMTQ